MDAQQSWKPLLQCPVSAGRAVLSNGDDGSKPVIRFAARERPFLAQPGR